MQMDPLDSLKRTHTLRVRHEQRLADLLISERSRAAQANDAGYSFAEIAKVLGVSRSRAQQVVKEGRRA